MPTSQTPASRAPLDQRTELTYTIWRWWLAVDIGLIIAMLGATEARPAPVIAGATLAVVALIMSAVRWQERSALGAAGNAPQGEPSPVRRPTK